MRSTQQQVYWDRQRQRLVMVGEPPMDIMGGRGSRRMRRGSARSIRRAWRQRTSHDNVIDRIVSTHRAHADEVERVGDKFRILSDEQEA